MDKVKSFHDFLTLLTLGLDVLERRVKEQMQVPARPEVDDPASSGKPAPICWSQRTPPGAGDVLIGVGRFAIPDGADNGLCLNNKGAASVLGEIRAIPSVTDLVVGADELLLGKWRDAVGPDLSSESFFKRHRLWVEDISSDSCFGLIAFLARLYGIAAQEIPQSWVLFIRQWEQGEIVIAAENYYASYGCLHTALVHPYFDRDSQGELGLGWVQGLRFMADALRSGCDPLDITARIGSPLYERARAFLRFEEQAYEESLRDAIKVQLLLPMSDKEARQNLVDAYLAEEVVVLGALKAFARRDRTRTDLKNGFSLMAIYRPSEIGTGGDYTISVDPSVGVSLKELWFELEAREDQAWAGQRPSDNPRHGLQAYEDGLRANGVTNAPDQPWWDGQDYTLLGAPKRISAGGPLGSRLSWKDVTEALWQTYQPFRQVRVRVGTKAVADNYSVPLADLRSLQDCSPEPTPVSRSPDEPRLFVAGWDRRSAGTPPFHVTPTLARYLAACCARKPDVHGPIKLADLPPEGSYDLLEMPGGVAVVTKYGAFILDAGPAASLPIHDLVETFETVLTIRTTIAQTFMKTQKLLEDTQAHLRGAKTKRSEPELLRELSERQIEIILQLRQAHTAFRPPSAERLYEALLARWGIQGWLDRLAEDVKEIRDVLRSRSEMIVNRRVAFLQSYGLPVAVASCLAGSIFTYVKVPAFSFTYIEVPAFSNNVENSPGGFLVGGVVMFVLLSLAGMVLVKAVSLLSDRHHGRSSQGQSRRRWVRPRG